MSFVNLTPNNYPDGKPILATSGNVLYEFSFVPSSTRVSAFLSRNMNNNEDCIVGLYLEPSLISLLLPANITNVAKPTTFLNGQIGLDVTNGSEYVNKTQVPNFIINNLSIGKKYILKTSTKFLRNSNFGARLLSGSNSLDIVYLKAIISEIINDISGSSVGPTGQIEDVKNTIPTGPTGKIEDVQNNIATGPTGQIATGPTGQIEDVQNTIPIGPTGQIEDVQNTIHIGPNEESWYITHKKKDLSGNIEESWNIKYSGCTGTNVEQIRNLGPWGHVFGQFDISGHQQPVYQLRKTDALPVDLAPVPSTPTGLIVANTTYGISLSWNKVYEASSYNIYRGGFILTTTKIPSFIDTNIIPGAVFVYSISAANSAGESPQSSSVSYTANSQFTYLAPIVNPKGIHCISSKISYYYFLFTPISQSIDVYIMHSSTTNKEAIIGIYDTDTPAINYLNVQNFTNFDSNVTYGQIVFENTILTGIQSVNNGEYTNSTNVPNFQINNLISDTVTPLTNLKTYILEIASFKNQPHSSLPDLAICFKNTGTGYNTQLIYNCVNHNRILPEPYVAKFDFSFNSQSDYTTYIYPYLYIYQTVLNFLYSTILSSPNARVDPTNDMTIQITVNDLEVGTLGESSTVDWAEDATRSPDFTAAQHIVFSKSYFDSGYLLGPSNFNGSSLVNNRSNILLFNVLLHEVHHGLGIYYSSNYNSTTKNIGWNSFLTGVSENDPWYKGPHIGGSAALSSYKSYCKNPSLLRIPIEEYFGEGTALSHWYYGDSSGNTVQYRSFNGIYHPAFTFELMTGFITNNQYLTRLTSGALKDYGYNINLNSPYITLYPFNQIPIQSTQALLKCSCHSELGKHHHKLYLNNPEHNLIRTPHSDPNNLPQQIPVPQQNLAIYPQNPGNWQPQNPGNWHPQNPGNWHPQNPGNWHPHYPGHWYPYYPWFHPRRRHWR